MKNKQVSHVRNQLNVCVFSGRTKKEEGERQKEAVEEEEEIKRSKICNCTEAASAQFVTIRRVDLALCQVLYLR